MKIALLDLPTQRMIASLTKEARARLDSVLEKIVAKENLGYRSSYFEATKSEYPSIQGVREFRAVKCNKTLRFEIIFSGGHVWKNNTLSMKIDLPESTVLSMRSQSLSQIVQHDLFEDMTVQKAVKKDPDLIEIEVKRLPGVDIMTVESQADAEDEVDLRTVLEDKGVKFTCRVFQDFVREDILSRKGQTLRNIARKIRDGRTQINLLAEGVRRPASCEYLSVELNSDKVSIRAEFKNGYYTGETLYLHGQSKSRQTITENRYFRIFRYQSGSVRKMKHPVVPLEAVFA
jgi:hypothetical protein